MITVQKVTVKTTLDCSCVSMSIFAVEFPFVLCIMGGTQLRHCAKSQQVASPIPDGAIFIDIILPAALWP